MSISFVKPTNEVHRPTFCSWHFFSNTVSTVHRPFLKPCWLSGSKPCSRYLKGGQEDPGEDLSCYTKERNAFVVVTGLAIALPFVEVNNGDALEILWNNSLCSHSLKELCHFVAQLWACMLVLFCCYGISPWSFAA